MFKPIKILVLSTLLLGACHSKKAIHDPALSTSEISIQTTKEYLSSFQKGEVEKVLAHTRFPLWLDGTIFPDENMFKQEISPQNALSRWTLLKAHYYTTTQAQAFAGRFIQKLKTNQMAHTHFVVLTFNTPRNRTEELIFSLEKQNGVWKIVGIEDNIHSPRQTSQDN